MGIEKSYESILRGKIGYDIVESNAKGKITQQIDKIKRKNGTQLS